MVTVLTPFGSPEKLILGAGMSLIMSDLRHVLDAYPQLVMPLGISLEKEADLLGIRKHLPAFICQPHRVTDPVKELHAELAFQIQDLLAQSRLGDVELLRYLREIERFGEPDGILQLFGVHSCSPFQQDRIIYTSYYWQTRFSREKTEIRNFQENEKNS